MGTSQLIVLFLITKPLFLIAAFLVVMRERRRAGADRSERAALEQTRTPLARRLDVGT